MLNLEDFSVVQKLLEFVKKTQEMQFFNSLIFFYKLQIKDC